MKVLPHHARAPRRLAVTAAAVLVLAAGLTGCGGGPPQPGTGLGAQGPCTRTDTSHSNPTVPGQTLHIFLPGGDASPPTGGTCSDDDRPVAVVVHGLFAGNPVLYDGIIAHLVSTGNIVIFATYDTDPGDFVGSFTAEDEAIVAATTHLTRGDLDRIGYIGHSMGGGAIPFLVQRADAHGWGDHGFWVMSLAPWVIAGVPEGTIDFPATAVVAVEAYSDDTYVPRSTGVDLFNRISTPLSRKQHVTLRTTSHNGVTLTAQHTTPNSIIAPDDAMKFYGIYRINDALQQCAHFSEHCDADLSFMGTWPDGTPVLPAISTDAPQP